MEVVKIVMEGDLRYQLAPRASSILRTLADTGCYFYAGEYAKAGRELQPVYLNNDSIMYKFDDGAWIAFDEIHASEATDLTFSDPISLKSRVIDAQVREMYNHSKKADLTETYTGTFEKTTTQEEAFLAGLETTVSAEIKGGGGGVEVSAGLSVTAKAEFTHSQGESETVSRQHTQEINIPAGVSVRVVGKRSIDEMKQTVSGVCQLEHKIHIYSAWGIDGHVKVDCWWDSFDAFIKTAQARGAVDSPFIDRFIHKPIDDTTHNILVHSGKFPINYDIIYDDVTHTTIEITDM